MSDGTKDIYEGIANARCLIEKHEMRSTYCIRRQERESQKVAAILKKEGVRSIVDVGCGRGLWIPSFLEVGADVCIGMEIAKTALPQRGQLDVQFIVGRAESMPFSAGALDAVFSSHVIEHLSDWKGFLRESNRVLKPGGILVIFTPNRSGLLKNRIISCPLFLLGTLLAFLLSVGAFRDFLSKIMDFSLSAKLYRKATSSKHFTWHEHEFRGSELREALEDTGFSEISIRYVGLHVFGDSAIWSNVLGELWSPISQEVEGWESDTLDRLTCDMIAVSKKRDKAKTPTS